MTLAGGFYHCFKDDGTIYDAVTRHLVGSTRFVFTYSMAIKTFFPSRKMSEIPYGHLPSSQDPFEHEDGSLATECLPCCPKLDKLTNA